MSDLEVSDREGLLLTAALNPVPEVAVSSWERWRSEIVLETAPYPELRLLPSVYANLARVAPGHPLPPKLRGKARAAFTTGKLRAHGIESTIEALRRESPVILAKGLAFCLRFNAWALRPFRDVDVFVPFERLQTAVELLRRGGWTPLYGLTWASLLGRTSLKRGSWNLTKDKQELDLHWSVLSGEAPDWLNRMMWRTAEPVDFFGGTFLQSAELAFASSLHHGFLEGDHGDALQMIVDAPRWLTICEPDRLSAILEKIRILKEYEIVIAMLRRYGLGKGAPGDAAAGGRKQRGQGIGGSPMGRKRNQPAIGAPNRLERAVLSRPAIYRLWQMLGRRASIERLLLTLTGPFSKPFAPPATFQQEYDLRDCGTIDRVAGPGFGWPEPERTCFWSDRADVRLLVPLSAVADHVVVVDLAEDRHGSPNPHIDVFANGTCVARLDLTQIHALNGYSLVVPKRCLFGPWVELSFRPNPYIGEAKSVGTVGPRRSLPFRTLKVYTMGKISTLLGFGKIAQGLIAGSESYLSKYGRIRQKINVSIYKTHADIPKDFDPEFYVLHYADLFEAEVDPYEHIVTHGRHEGRVWRPS